MKIDMMSVMPNSIKKIGLQQECNKNFVDLFDSTEAQNKVEDEIMGLISSLFNNINTQRVEEINNKYDIFEINNINLNENNFIKFDSLDGNEKLISTLENMIDNSIKQDKYISEMSKLVLNKDVNEDRDLQIKPNTLENTIFKYEKIVKNENIANYKLFKLDEVNEITYENKNNTELDMLDFKIKTHTFNKLIDNNDLNKVEELLYEEKKTIPNILDSEDKNILDADLNLLKSLSTYSNTNIDTNNLHPKNIRQEFITRDINQVIKYLNNNNIEELNLKMSPKELGDITIKLIKSEKENRVIVTLGKEDIFNLINKNLKELENVINTTVKEVHIEVKCENQNDFSQNLNQQFNKNNHSNKNNKEYDIDNKIEEDDKGIEDNNINLLA